MKSDNSEKRDTQKTGPPAPNMFAPNRAADDRPTDITLRSRAALRVMSGTDVRQHTILLNFRVICLSKTVTYLEIFRFYNFSPN